MADPVNNGPSNPANAGRGESPALDQLYQTLGAVQAGIDVRQQETDDENAKLLEQEKALIEERDRAAEQGDLERADRLSRQLDEIREAWLVNHQDEEPADAGTDQRQEPQRGLGGERAGERQPEPGEPG